MHPTATRYQEVAREEYGLDVEVRELPEGTHSAEDAAAAIGCPLAAIVKSVVLVTDGDPAVAYASGEHRVDLDALAAHLGVDEVRTADADEVKEVTGWSIGGVPAVGHGIDRTLLDGTLLEHDVVWSGAGTPAAVASFDPEPIQSTTGAEVADVFE